MRNKRKILVRCLLAGMLLTAASPAVWAANEDTAAHPAPQASNVRTITGRVIDADGHTLPGATILLKGATKGVISDMDGKFFIDVPDKDVTLQISYIGMETQEVKVPKNKKEVTITLKENTHEINEVVVTGYANLKKESFTGNAVTIKKDELQKVSQSNVIAAIQAFDPSFRIAENSAWGSDPNSLPEVYIRGKSGIGIKELDVDVTSKSSLKNNPNLPTFIMDGFEISVTKLYDMDPSRIESVTILKDAAATAIYGSRAANGVVVITTVTPKPGKLNVSYSLTGEVEMPDLSDYHLLNARDKLEAERIAGAFDASIMNTSNQTELDKLYYQKLYNVQNGVDTYWLSQPLRTSLNTNHSLYIDGGSDQLRFGVELNLNNDKGVMKGSERNVWGAGAYIQYTINKLVVRNHFTYDVNRSKESPYGTFSDYTKQLPYDVFKDDNGKYLEKLPTWGNKFFSEQYNPLYESTLGNYSRSSYEQIVNNLSLQWNFTHYLLLKSTLGLTRQFNKSESFIDPASQKNSTLATATNLTSGELNTSSGDLFTLDWQASLAYNRFIKEHNINASIGINVMETKSNGLSSRYQGFPSGNLSSPNYAERIINKPTSSEEHSRLMGLIGLINYSFQNIYLFDASIRMDGSSKFGSEKKYAPFWSFGAGLNIHNYKFMQDFEKIDLLKVRASYGQVGKVNFASYDAKTTYRLISDQWYKTGYGATLYALGNKNLKWETTNTLDVGMELSLLKRLFYFRGSYYVKRTVDCINSVTIPSHTGFTTYMDNIGEIENKGFELDVQSNFIRTKDWNVTVFGNLAHNDNKILKIAESLKSYNDRVDQALNSPYSTGVVKSKSYRKYQEGISQSAIWAMKSLGIDPASGQEIYLNPDGTVTKHWDSANQVMVGDEEPAIQGSFGLNVTWKRFSLYTTFMYECGGQRYNQTLADKVEGVDILRQNVDSRVLSGRWKAAGDLAPYKAIQVKPSTSVTVTKATSRFVQDYNWMNLNSITLEYDFEPQLIKPLGLNMLRLGIGANDLARWSSVKQERGLSYPYSKTINFSLKASF